MRGTVLPGNPTLPSGASLSPLDVIRLRSIMDRTSGAPEVSIALIDGPLAVDHPALAAATIRHVGETAGPCRGSSVACQHGTFVAGVLVASRESGAAAICPGCTLLVRPIFSDMSAPADRMPIATLDVLANAIVETVNTGARLLNVSAALGGPSRAPERRLLEALDHAAQRGALVIVAAGNQAIGSSAITRHPWVVPVLACDPAGLPVADANVSHATGRRGLLAPGVEIRSLEAGGTLTTRSGSSASAPFVTGTFALLWSLFPAANANDLRIAVTHATSGRRRSIVPPLLDATAAFMWLATRYAERAS
jgi:subtilisin family serine protease